MRNPIKNAWYALWHNPRHIIFAIIRRLPWIIPSDSLYLRVIYRLECGVKLNLDNPTTFNEKLQWLKLYNRCLEYGVMVDKYAVKDYVAKIIGEQYVIPTIGVWDNAKNIDFGTLPSQFVLKTTHDGGNNGVVVCKDKSRINKATIIKKLNKSLRRNTYLIGREWPYKLVPHRIIAEKYMEDEYGELRDYKFFCFNGEVKAVFIATDRGNGDVKFDFFDDQFNHLDLVQTHPMSGKTIQKPISFEKMKELASKLSINIPQVRVDFYEVNGHPYFGELTFFHHGGIVPFHPSEWDRILGDWLTLPNEKIE